MWPLKVWSSRGCSSSTEPWRSHGEGQPCYQRSLQTLPVRGWNLQPSPRPPAPAHRWVANKEPWGRRGDGGRAERREKASWSTVSCDWLVLPWSPSMWQKNRTHAPDQRIFWTHLLIFTGNNSSNTRAGFSNGACRCEESYFYFLKIHMIFFLNGLDLSCKYPENHKFTDN